jgi:hypothetical protein
MVTRFDRAFHGHLDITIVQLLLEHMIWTLASPIFEKNLTVKRRTTFVCIYICKDME